MTWFELWLLTCEASISDMEIRLKVYGTGLHRPASHGLPDDLEAAVGTVIAQADEKLGYVTPAAHVTETFPDAPAVVHATELGELHEDHSFQNIRLDAVFRSAWNKRGRFRILVWGEVVVWVSVLLDLIQLSLLRFRNRRRRVGGRHLGIRFWTCGRKVFGLTCDHVVSSWNE